MSNVSLTPKQRTLYAMNRLQTDRPPMFATLTPQTAKKLSYHLNLKYEEPLDSLLSTRISHMDLLTHLGNDCVGIAGCAPKNFPTKSLDNKISVNEWGMKFIDVGNYFEFYEYPLANATSIEEIESYPWPDPLAEGRFDAAISAIEKYGEKYAVVADLETSFFETAWYMVGMEKLLMSLALEEEYAFALLDKIMHINTEIGKKLIEYGADIIWAGDDFGTQRGMMIDPDMWREIFKPRIKWMFGEFRKVNPDIKIAWHSCGSIVPIIGDFAEIGLDILNPIQPLAEGMYPEYLANNHGHELCFFGGIDIQNLLPLGTPEQIKDEIHRRIDILGKNGGYLVAPAHNIQDDTPVENILAFFDAVKTYKY
jgi:uroporphyrinogen decarboxylase